MKKLIRFESKDGHNKMHLGYMEVIEDEKTITLKSHDDQYMNIDLCEGAIIAYVIDHINYCLNHSKTYLGLKRKLKKCFRGIK